MSNAAAVIESARAHTSSVIQVPEYGVVKVSFYQVRTVTFCLLVFNEDTGYGTEFFDFAKCHTKDHNNRDIGRRKALGRALALTPLTREQRLEVVAAVFPPF
jgi:hypothetical protein